MKEDKYISLVGSDQERIVGFLMKPDISDNAKKRLKIYHQRSINYCKNCSNHLKSCNKTITAKENYPRFMIQMARHTSKDLTKSKPIIIYFDICRVHKMKSYALRLLLLSILKKSKN